MWQRDQRKDRSSRSKQAVEHGGHTGGAYKEAHALSVQTAYSVLLTDNHVLEIGCGTGIVTPGATSHVQQALKFITLTPLIWGFSAEDLNSLFSAGSFDVVR